MIDVQLRRSAAALAALLTISGVLAGCSPAPAPAGSRCSTSALVLSCPYVVTDLTAAGVNRQVLWQVPNGTAPAGGWPVAILFQGSVATPVLTWAASPVEPFGAYYQTQLVQRLLDDGYAVLTPVTHLAGLTFWDTNNPLVPNHDDSNDHAFMLSIFDALAAGTFGNTNPARLYAAGISSGGYMTSRMAVSYPGRFKALAIQSASYATCIGPLCDIGTIPADHPPTLFLHGFLDPIVPIFTMRMYYEKLVAAGIETERIIDPLANHQWIPPAPEAVLDWFRSHP